MVGGNNPKAPPPQKATAELNRINQDSLRNYAIFRENMLTHFALTKLRKRHGADLDADDEG